VTKFWKGFIWKGIIGFVVLEVGAALFLSNRLSISLTGIVGMDTGFFLLFFGPIFFWIILPLKNKWHKLHLKRFIITIILCVAFLLIVVGSLIIYSAPRYIKLGDSIVVNHIKIMPISTTYTHTKIVVPNSWSESSEAKRGYIFLVIKFKCKNVGNYISSASIDTAKILTTRGYFYDLAAPDFISFSDIQPGDTRSYYIKFEIPKDQKGVKTYFKIGLRERILKL